MGRAEEIQYFHQLCADWVRGRSNAIVVAGPVGSGKTSLLREVAGYVREAGGLFFSVAATASEQAYALSMIELLVRALCAAGMPDPWPPGDVGAPVAWLRQDPGGLLRRVSDAICAFAGGRRIVIGVDDLHFADAPSLLCLGHLIRRIERAGILIVLTESTAHERGLAGLHAETLNLAYCHHIRLSPLNRDATATLVVERLGGPPPPGLLRLCAEAGGGSPVLLHALIDDCTVDDPVPGPPAPGAAYRQAVLRCLNRCEPQTLAVARAVAVLRGAAKPGLLGEFLGLDPMSVRAALLVLRDVGVLVSDRFRHEEGRLAVLSGIPADALAAMHLHAAGLLHEAGEPATAVADQLMAARDPAEESWRVSILNDAAREAVAAGDVAEAVAYLRYAAGHCTDGGRRARLTARLADARWNLGPSGADRHLGELHSAVRAGLLTGPDAQVPVRLLLWRGAFAEADDLIRSGGRPPGAAPRNGTLAELWDVFCAREHRGETKTEIKNEIRTASGTTGAEAHGTDAAWSPLDAAAMFLHTMLTPVHGGDQALGDDRRQPGLPVEGSLSSLVSALGLMLQRGRLEETANWSRRLVEEPWIRRVPMRRVMFEMFGVIATLRLGGVEDARELIDDVLSVVPAYEWGVVAGLPLAAAVQISTELGDTRQAARHLMHPVPAAMFDTPFALPYLSAVGDYRLAMGDARAALTHFLAARDLLARWGRGATVTGWRNDAAAALIALGRRDQARAYAEELLSRLEGRRTRARGIALWRLAVAGEAAARPALLTEAIEVLESHGDRLSAAKVRAELDSLGTDTAPVPVRRRPFVRAARTPSEPAGNVRKATAPGTPRLPHPRWGELTDAERRVAALAADGATNRQISDRLFITVSTVEQHLTKIYRKLNVRSRSGLPTF
ncbi:AAA family ATPase [Actinoplanes sp. NPDC051851]|uniref:helix-turn-helix transcriptional regulator n=1 Tax=Actinoplanes sp. NPDC051851 TaxID=3154753 RepID=UPI00343EAE3F